MMEEPWHEARLIPTSGINGPDEQERRATSALLAVMVAVREFGKALTHPFGAPAGRIEAFIEVPFMLGEKRCFPDGLIRISRGSQARVALVEVKTGKNRLSADQLEDYLEIAREQGFDAILSISNEIPAVHGQHPTKVDKRKLRRVDLHHLAWTQVLFEAVMQKEYRGVADPDQAWILGELIRYLEHPRSGALELDDMGDSWVPVRDAVAAGTLRTTDQEAADVVSRFDALLRFASLNLGRELGIDVTPALTRKELAEPAGRAQALIKSLAAAGMMQGAIRIPDTVGPLVVTVDLRANQVICHADVDAPTDGRPTTRVNWLVRQLRAAPETVRIEAHTAYSRRPNTAELLRDVRERPELLIGEPGKPPRSFRVAMARSLGSKRGRGRGSFIDSVLDAIHAFYGEVVQDLKTWSPAPPRIREPVERQPVPVSLPSTALSSQDGLDQDPLGEGDLAAARAEGG